MEVFERLLITGKKHQRRPASLKIHPSPTPYVKVPFLESTINQQLSILQNSVDTHPMFSDIEVFGVMKHVAYVTF